jgi:hypothetical protein
MPVNEVFVTNRNPKPHRDRYDGKEYLFLPNEAVAIPVEAARHFFGYGLPDKTEALQRMGKAFRYIREENAFGEDPEGVKFLARFEFEEAVLQPASALRLALAEAHARSHATLQPSLESLLG